MAATTRITEPLTPLASWSMIRIDPVIFSNGHFMTPWYRVTVVGAIALAVWLSPRGTDAVVARRARGTAVPARRLSRHRAAGGDDLARAGRACRRRHHDGARAGGRHRAERPAHGAGQAQPAFAAAGHGHRRETGPCRGGAGAGLRARRRDRPAHPAHEVARHDLGPARARLASALQALRAPACASV